MKFHGKAVYIIGQHFSSSVLKKLIRTDKSKESVQEVLPYILSSELSARTHLQEMCMHAVGVSWYRTFRYPFTKENLSTVDKHGGINPNNNRHLIWETAAILISKCIIILCMQLPLKLFYSHKNIVYLPRKCIKGSIATLQMQQLNEIAIIKQLRHG